MKTSPEEFCQRIGEVTFKSKPGPFVSKLVIIGDNIEAMTFFSWGTARRTS
jgi:hypothetical protein